MTTVRKLLQKYRALLSYGVFGVLTTLINIVCYQLLYKTLGVPNVPANIAAWVLSVAFAFITNKLWVFESKNMAPAVLLPELTNFVGCRLATGAMDLAIMFVGVDLLAGPSLPIKIASNILVIIINYLFSKLVIFAKKK